MTQAETLTTLHLPRVRPPRRPRPPVTTVVALVLGSVVLGAVGYRLVAGGGGSTVSTGNLGSTPPAEAPATTAASTPATTAGPRPTTAPPATSATTVTTRPERLTSDSRLSLDGIGPVRVGMTLAEASAAGGVPLRLFDQPPGPECRYAGPERGSALGDELGFMVYEGRIVRIDVGVMGPDRIRTVSGIGKGATEAEVLRTYPGRIRTEAHPYVQGGKWLIYMPADASYRHLTMVFEVVEGRVMTFRSGYLEPTLWTEGCS